MWIEYKSATNWKVTFQASYGHKYSI